MHIRDVTKIAEKARTILISLNPRSGASNRRELVEELAAALENKGFETRIVEDLDQLCDTALDSLQNGRLRTVVVAGGDGTASLLVNRLPAEVPFTIFPLGTANLVAKFLDASLDIQRTVETISAGNAIDLDAGKANDRLFLVVASCGFDADVVDRIHKERKGHITYWSYGMPIINSIRKYQFPKMRLVADGRSLDPARWAFIFNIPQYAMDLRFIENADAQDGQLDLCTFRDGGFFQGLFYFFAVLFRRHRAISASRFTRFRQLQIESRSQVPIELDGDPGGYLPVDISVVPNRFRVIVSDRWIDANRTTS